MVFRGPDYLIFYFCHEENLMEFSTFQIINFVLAGALIVLFVRYLIIVYIERGIQPAEWKHLKKQKEITPELIRLEKRYADQARFHSWFLQVRRIEVEKIPGAFAELGVYKGESAEILHTMAPDRRIHLFDTFSGFDAGDLRLETGDAAGYTPEHFADTAVDAVKVRLGNSSNVFLHIGHFPSTAAGFNEPLALVNLDADLYLPTKSALEIFYPLLSPGGVIFIHDHHPKWPGILQAVREFCLSIPETPVFLPDNYGTVVIVKNK